MIACNMKFSTQMTAIWMLCVLIHTMVAAPGRRGAAAALTCGGTSSNVETTFTNPSFPNAETESLGSCQLKIKHSSNDTCQVRLEMTEFTLAQPNSKGVCSSDFMQVSGGSSNTPVICGDNSGQHMYVEAGPEGCSVVINIDTSSSGSKWSITATQIECNSREKAPPGCLQYFTHTSGTIASFNSHPTANTTQNAFDTRQLANQAYGMCIKTQPGYCSVTYRQVAGSSFSLSGDPSAYPPGGTLPALVGAECSNDYLLVPNAGHFEDTSGLIDPTTIAADRFCGMSFPGVTHFVAPFNIYLVTTGEEIINSDLGNQGFMLNYRMNAC